MGVLPEASRSFKRALVESAGLAVTSLSCRWLRRVREHGVSNLPKTSEMMRLAGVYPLTTGFYDPLWTSEDLEFAQSQRRSLPGIDFARNRQNAFIESLDFVDELDAFPRHPIDGVGFHHRNGFFEGCDAEFLYSFIRKTKPRRILEIGSGYSTRMAVSAIEANRREDSAYVCDLTCVEPFCNPWLEQLDARIIRDRVEALGPEVFSELKAGDICFIDSSHIIRPGRDVLYLYLEVIPALNPGVNVHVHDIFTPHDYPVVWRQEYWHFWNEQYLLEAFLSCNGDWEVTAALSMLAAEQPSLLATKFPAYAELGGSPGSFWMRRVQ